MLQETSLLLYNGPQSTPPTPRDPSSLGDFVAVELANGYPRARWNLGGGEVLLEIRDAASQAPLTDGKWHKLELMKSGKV